MPACVRSCWPADCTNSTKHGAVAQLGERCVRNAEVEGSIPFRSTNPANGRKYRPFFYAKAVRRSSVSHMPWRDAPRSTQWAFLVGTRMQRRIPLAALLE